ncbi:MAG: phosphotransferase [Bacteroidaceae bacterium]|nr:phosphotransferase [Bacteroidaceae bacterium]
MTTLNKILDFTGGEKFYRFGNADGKRWVVPAQGMCTALSLYQPSGRKGKMVKALLPYLHRIPFVRKAIKAETQHCRLSSELHTLLCNTFGVEDIEFGLFEGTPCVHQKITMQVSRGDKILGYCKFSDNNNIKGLFEKEASMLQWLANKGIKNIPKALYCGTLNNGTDIFVQSTVKSKSSKTIHEWGALHDEFLACLHEKTKQSILFENSDYCKTLNALEEHLEWLPVDIDRKVIATAIAKVRSKFCGKEVEFSAYHGDFTPWNMFVEKGNLFVFDFEYAAMSYPPELDLYHFFTQTAIFEKHWKSDDFATYINCDKGRWIDKRKYAMYLLDVISRFMMREGGKVTGEAATPFALWENVLKNLI